MSHSKHSSKYWSGFYEADGLTLLWAERLKDWKEKWQFDNLKSNFYNVNTVFPKTQPLGLKMKPTCKCHATCSNAHFSLALAPSQSP